MTNLGCEVHCDLLKISTRQPGNGYGRVKLWKRSFTPVEVFHCLATGPMDQLLNIRCREGIKYPKISDAQEHRHFDLGQPSWWSMMLLDNSVDLDSHNLHSRRYHIKIRAPARRVGSGVHQEVAGGAQWMDVEAF